MHPSITDALRDIIHETKAEATQCFLDSMRWDLLLEDREQNKAEYQRLRLRVLALHVALDALAPSPAKHSDGEESAQDYRTSYALANRSSLL